MKKLPMKATVMIVLSGLLLAACDDTRVRVSADTGYYSGPRVQGSAYLTHTPYNHRISYDSALGMYIVAGLANTYWNDGHYYRYNNRNWQRSRDYRRWNRMNQRHVPTRLYKRYNKPVIYTDHSNNRVRIDRSRRSRPRRHRGY